MNAKQTIEETVVETPEETMEAASKVVADTEGQGGEHLPAIREDLGLRAVKFTELDQEGNPTGHTITLEGYFGRWARHEVEGRSLSAMLGSFAAAVAETNADLSPDAQVHIFRSLCRKGAEKAFPMIAAVDDFGNIVYNPSTDEPALKQTMPASYRTMLSGTIALWTGKNEKGKVQHDPIIPGREYEIYDGRKGEMVSKRIVTIGQMMAVKRTMDRQKKLKEAEKLLKRTRALVDDTIQAAASGEFAHDAEVINAVETAVKLKEAEKPIAVDIKKANDNLIDVLAKRKTEAEAKKKDADDTATPEDKKAAETVEATSNTDGETLAVDMKTGDVHLEQIGLERHISASEAFKLKHIGVLMANLEGKPRDALSAALDVVINTTYQENKGLEKKMEAFRREQKAAMKGKAA